LLSILVVNVGSTSLKFKLLAFEPAELARPNGVPAEGRIEGIGRPVSRTRIKVGADVREEERGVADYAAALDHVLRALDLSGGSPGGGVASRRLSAVCFKPVHACPLPVGVVEMDEATLAAMEAMNSVAPAHNPPVIAAVRAFRALLPATPLLGLFEPDFHRTLPPEAWLESVPLAWVEAYGVRKYGFHGASHRYIAERAPDVLGVPAEGLKLISCHLGGSSSVAAVLGGRSRDTSMSFSPQSGLPQGARCGQIDPFIALYLIQARGLSVEEVAGTLARRSGLLGLSGVSAEFREIEAAAMRGEPDAERAISVFVYQVQGEIARMTVPLQGLEALVFTGGIGEQSPGFRRRVCDGLAHLGVRLDAGRNQAAVGCEAEISRSGSAVRVLTLPTDEELILGREAAGWLMRQPPGAARHG